MWLEVGPAAVVLSVSEVSDFSSLVNYCNALSAADCMFDQCFGILLDI